MVSTIQELDNEKSFLLPKCTTWGCLVTPFDLTLKSYQHTKLLELGIEPVIYRMRVSDIETTILWAVVWLSWNSGRFQFQRSAVQIQSSTKINCIEKTKIKKNRSGMAHYFKNYHFHRWTLLPMQSQNRFQRSVWRFQSFLCWWRSQWCPEGFPTFL